MINTKMANFMWDDEDTFCTRKQHQHRQFCTAKEISTDQKHNSRRRKKRFNLFHPSLLLLLPWLQLHNLVDVQYALPLVHLRRFAAPDSAGKVVHPILV